MRRPAHLAGNPLLLNPGRPDPYGADDDASLARLTISDAKVVHSSRAEVVQF
jgi:hypothetical protein